MGRGPKELFGSFQPLRCKKKRPPGRDCGPRGRLGRTSEKERVPFPRPRRAISFFSALRSWPSWTCESSSGLPS